MNELTIKNFETLELNELEAIDGGSAVGILGGSLGGATTGVKVCTPGGPWAMAACGIGGAVIGGALAD